MNESRITRTGKGKDKSKLSAHKKRLNEKELGTLYAYCGTPLRLHSMLEKDFPKADDFEGAARFDPTDFLSEIHDGLSAQGPDDALLSLSLMAWILEDYCIFYYELNDELRVLCTELKCESENVIHDLGRLRIDLDSYRAEISETEIFEHLKGVPDSLCILASIFAEAQDVFKNIGRKDLSKLARLLCYQAESQADYAWGYVEMMTGKAEDDGAQDAAARDIPLPFDMQPDRDESKVIDLSLFRRR